MKLATKQTHHRALPGRSIWKHCLERMKSKCSRSSDQVHLTSALRRGKPSPHIRSCSLTFRERPGPRSAAFAVTCLVCDSKCDEGHCRSRPKSICSNPSPGPQHPPEALQPAGSRCLPEGVPAFGYKGTMTRSSVGTPARDGYLLLSSWHLLFEFFCFISTLSHRAKIVKYPALKVLFQKFPTMKSINNSDCLGKFSITSVTNTLSFGLFLHEIPTHISSLEGQKAPYPGSCSSQTHNTLPLETNAPRPFTV